MPPKSRVASKDATQPLKSVDLSGLYRINDHTVGRIVYRPDAPVTNTPGSSIYWAKSLDHHGARICVDGVYWIPAASGIVVGWVEREVTEAE